MLIYLNMKSENNKLCNAVDDLYCSCFSSIYSTSSICKSQHVYIRNI